MLPLINKNNNNMKFLTNTLQEVNKIGKVIANYECREVTVGGLNEELLTRVSDMLADFASIKSINPHILSAELYDVTFELFFDVKSNKSDMSLPIGVKFFAADEHVYKLICKDNDLNESNGWGVGLVGIVSQEYDLITMFDKIQMPSLSRFTHNGSGTYDINDELIIEGVCHTLVVNVKASYHEVSYTAATNLQPEEYEFSQPQIDDVEIISLYKNGCLQECMFKENLIQLITEYYADSLI